MLAKLHVATGKLPDLSALIEQPNAIVLSEIEPELVKSRNVGVLCRLYQQHGNDAKLLDAWSNLVDGQWTDAQVQDPLTRIFDLLGDKKDRTLIQHWIPWLVKKDSDRALKVRALITRIMVQPWLIRLVSYCCLLCPRSAKLRTTEHYCSIYAKQALPQVHSSWSISSYNDEVTCVE